MEKLNNPEKALMRFILSSEFHNQSYYIDCLNDAKKEMIISIAEKTELGDEFIKEHKKDLEFKIYIK